MFEYEVKFVDGLVTVSVQVWVDERSPQQVIERALAIIVRHSGVSFDVATCRRVEIEYVGVDNNLGGN